MTNMHREISFAKKIWPGELNAHHIEQLRLFIKEYGFSVENGSLLLIDGRWYVTHSGLVRLARRKKCSGIHVEAVPALCDSTAGRYVVRATVFPTRNSTGFAGIGDADPSNTSPLVRGAELRMAEVRAANRALRKAYAVAVCSLEEIGSSAPSSTERIPPQSANGDGNGTGPKVRDRLCQVIRQHKLDPELVKAYAIDYCGTKTLREASREQVENFVRELAQWAEKDRNALVCQLNSYAQPKKEGAA